MALQNRLRKLERKRQAGPALIFMNPGETEKAALQRCYLNKKPERIMFFDEYDLLA